MALIYACKAVDPARYIGENFEPTDRLAVVLLNKRSGLFIQRLAEANQIAASGFQNWLRDHNEQRYEVYISMNALRPDAKGPRKEDVAVIRHVYLDFDQNGTPAVAELLKRADLPTPNYVLNSSPDKWQVVWRVQGFGKEEAEEIQRGLARQMFADPAATDCSRVLRLPGFTNHKYDAPHLVTVECYASQVWRPEQFPKIPMTVSVRRDRSFGSSLNGRKVALSQSERDWAYAKRALARGDSFQSVTHAIASYRAHDKHNPRCYAELTVRKAEEALRAEHGNDGMERA